MASHVEDGVDPNEKGADWRGPTTTTTTPEPTEAEPTHAEQGQVDVTSQTEPLTSEQGETEYKPLGPRGERVKQIDDVLKGAGESAQQELAKQISEANDDGPPSEQEPPKSGGEDVTPKHEDGANSTELPGSD